MTKPPGRHYFGTDQIPRIPGHFRQPASLTVAIGAVLFSTTLEASGGLRAAASAAADLVSQRIIELQSFPDLILAIATSDPEMTSVIVAIAITVPFGGRVIRACCHEGDVLRRGRARPRRAYG
jgi:ABC-type dipeptide/oligopeptide/nickel transport system permease subunit